MVSKTDWIKLAESERHASKIEQQSLHLLNSVIEEKCDSDARRILWDEFEVFLSSRSFSTAHEAIEAFATSRSTSGTPNTLRGPPVSAGREILSTVLNLRSARDLILTSKLGYGLAPNFTILENELKLAPSEGSLASSDVKKLEAWHDKVQDLSVNVEQKAAVLAAVPGGTTVTTSKKASASKVIWLTRESSVNQIVNTGALNRRSPRVRSYIGSLRRYCTGLFHKSDMDNIERSLPSSPDPTYRLMFEVHVSSDDPELQNVNQPTIFSKGDRYLYISSLHNSTSGGRTCRLEKVKCRHKNDACKCAMEGVPEMLSSEDKVSSADSIQLKNSHFLLTRHLRKFKRPNVDFIHYRRGI